jgi:hypothetical protein
MTYGKPTVQTLHKDVSDLKDAVKSIDHRQSSIEEKADLILSVIGPQGLIRRHGMRALSAIMGAAVYAGFIDGKIGMFFTRLLGL